jgi:hypothetical protein
VRLSDGAVLKLKILIVDVKEAGFSPFGGVSFDVKVVGGVAVESLPDSVRGLVDGKPFAPPETPPGGLGDFGCRRAAASGGPRSRRDF